MSDRENLEQFLQGDLRRSAELIWDRSRLNVFRCSLTNKAIKGTLIGIDCPGFIERVTVNLDALRHDLEKIIEARV